MNMKSYQMKLIPFILVKLLELESNIILLYASGKNIFTCS